MTDKKDLDKLLEGFTQKEVLQHITNKYDGSISIKDAYGMTDQLLNTTIAYSTCKEDYIPKEYLSLEFGCIAYQHILDTGCNAQDAMVYAASTIQENEEYVNDTKNRRYYYSKQVVKDNDNHPKQQEMKKKKTIDISGLKGAKTMNQQLRKLHSCTTLHDNIIELESKVDQQEEDINNLQSKTTATDMDIKYLQEELGVECMPPKEKAAKMKQLGYTQKQIAEAVGRSIPTIKRWWSDL